MKHITIDYGIDLGTTNSAICRMQRGEPVIIRSDSGMETMPSCVSFKKGGVVRVGQSAYSDLGRDKLRALKRRSTQGSDSCIEFKRYMGSDTSFANVNVDYRLSPEELSAKVVSALCSFVTDDQVQAAVITVPAKFTVNQKDATINAARLAGIKQIELLQEPIAASMAYGLKAEEKNGIWMVFDLGGGTLDVALVHVSDGVMQVFDTEGDNYLGGKNLDEAIVTKIIMPELTSRYAIDIADPLTHKLLTEALKVEAEKLKNKLSFRESEQLILEAGDWGEDDDDEEIELDITVTRQQVEDAIRPLLQKAVDVCKTLMMRNNLTFGQLSHLILIGGPTYIPLLRKMLSEQITPNVETGIDPMTAVATGAAIYASTLPCKVSANSDGNDDDTLQLDIEFDTITVDTVSYVPIKTDTHVPGLQVKAIRRADGWESQLTDVDTAGNILTLDLMPKAPNIFRIAAFIQGHEVKCFSSEITIVQGSKAGSAVLPYNIGMEVYNPKKDKYVFVALNGLEKNRPLPAKGTVYGLKTMSALLPANPDDVLRIAIYQGDDNAEGQTASLFEYVSDVKITGEDIATYIPEGSELNITINVDRSEMMSVNAEFTQTAQSVTKKLDTSLRQSERDADYLADMIHKGQIQLRNLSALMPDIAELQDLYKRLSSISDDLAAGAQHKQVEQHIKEVLRKTEIYDGSSEWFKSLSRLKRAFSDLQITAMTHTSTDNKQNIKETIDYYNSQIKIIETFEDVNRANELRAIIEDYDYNLAINDHYRGFLRNINRDFEHYNFTDRQKARALIIEGINILANNPKATVAEIGYIVDQVNSMIVRETVKTVIADQSQDKYSRPNDLPSM